MPNMTFLKRTFMVVLLGTAMTAFADEAPVFDADNYPPQFDGQPDSNAAAAPEAPSSAQAPSQVQTYAAPPASDNSVPVASNLTSEQRIARLEQQITNMQHAESSGQLDAMHHEIQTLRGQVDSLTHQLQQVQSQQKSMYADLDKRISKPTTLASVASTDTTSADDVVKPVAKKKLAAKAKAVAPAADPSTTTPDASSAVAPAATAAAVAPAKNAAQPNVAEEQQVYQTAYDLIKSKKYDQAIASLKGMLNKYPTGQFAANAHYWLGELYGLQAKNDQSAVEFSTVVNNYPESPKVSDAQLKLGLIYAAQFKWGDAKSAFKKVINHYPGTASARLASEQLKQIKLAGH